MVRTVAQKFKAIGTGHNQLKNGTANDFEWFFLGLDESTNVIDTIQLFIQRVKC